MLVRTKGGEVDYVPGANVDYMDVSPRQMVSVATAMIPFLEHDDANRALMGSNMQRQSVPLLRSEAPLVGTGMEYRAATDAGDVIVAEAGRCRHRGVGRRDHGRAGRRRVPHLPACRSSVAPTRARASTSVRSSTRASASRPARSSPTVPAPTTARWRSGRNLLVAFMPWEGHNYEDAIILSRSASCRTTSCPRSTSRSTRSTPATPSSGPEEITRDIPNVSEEVLADLDERGIIRIGADVVTGDILVGKVTPKGETELTPEERLLRAIFGEKAREVRDTSLKVPHGESGKVIGVRVFDRDEGDELPPGVNRLVRVYIAQKRKITNGDKLAGRHGNKGVISKILPVEDMPFLEDGTPVDIVLNPLGVPGRMNVGQVLETHLGWVAKTGWEVEGNARLGARTCRRGRVRGAARHQRRDPGLRRCPRGGDHRPARLDDPDAGRRPARRRRRQGPAHRRSLRRAVPRAGLGRLRLHPEAAPPGRRQDPRPFDRPLLDDHAAAPGR